MASVQDVFAQMQAEQAEILADEAFTPDPEEYCTLESDATRRILIPQKYAVFGVESDDKTNRIKFAFPKAVNDIQDLSQYNLRFNYIDAKGNTDQITARNMKVQGDYVLFDWILTRNVTRYQGNISFIVCAVTVKEDGVISNEWNTTIATAQSLEGIETEPTPGEEQIARDLLTELLVSLNNSKNDAITEITQTKTQAISDIETEGQTQTEAVDAKGAQVLESIPDDYTTLENRVDELEQNRAYVIVGNGSGEFITLNDSSELKTRNVKLFGKSVQAETTGAQLFDLKSYVEEVSDAEIIDYKTGEFTLDTSNIQINTTALINLCPKMVSGNSYLLIGETTSNKKYLYVGSKKWNFGEVFIPDENDLSEQCFFNCTTITSESGEVEYYKDTFKNIMIVEGSTEKPYEVYTGGQAATEPSPDYPLPITSAGNYNAEAEKYEVGIGVTGKNLFDASKVPTKTQVGATVTNNGDGSFSISGSGNLSKDYWNEYRLYHDEILKMLRVGKIKVSSITATRPNFNFQFRNQKKVFVELTPSNVEGEITQKMIDDENGYIVIGFYGTSGLQVVSGTVRPIIQQVEDETWEPFKQQLSTLQLPNPLRGIPVDSGGNYTDAEGQQWLCDYIDRERGKYVQCVQEIVFDGVSSRKKVTNADPAYYSNANYAYISVTGIKSYSNTISNKLKYIGNQIYKNIEGIIITGVISISLLNTRTGIVSTDSEQQRVDKINAVLKQWYDEGNPLVVYYQLANPIETDLTADQLAALNLSTYQGITNIGTDTMPQVGVEVEYIADTKTYIDNAIAEAIAAIPTEQGGNKL